MAQGAPLYRSFTVGETIEFARSTNPRWDATRRAATCSTRLSADARVSSLPAGERARLALALALGKRPRAAPPRRAVRPPRPARRARVPAAAHGRRRRDSGDGRDRVARDRRHRARLRPHRAPERRPRPARGQRRGAPRLAPPADRRAPAARPDPRRRRDRAPAAQRTADDAARPARRPDRRPVLGGRASSASRSSCSPTWRPSACPRPQPPGKGRLRWHG